MSVAPDREREIVVPGSIANLGPAFDALSVAVSVYLRVRVLDVLPADPGLLDMRFERGSPPGENRIAMAFRRAEAHFRTRAPGLRVEVRSDIPMRAGLGSSAAATVAGLRLFEAVTGPKPAGELLAIATDVEGHPDNAAAALHGGLALSCQLEDGRVEARVSRWPDDLGFVVATPEAELETAFARQVLPETLPLRDAVFNLQRALLFVRALEDHRYGDLREALRDRWHQPHRMPYVPGLEEALALDHPAVLGVCLSGAGPSIAVLTPVGQDAASLLLREIYAQRRLPCTIRMLTAHQPVPGTERA
jgi:homoserine kinase